jgi:hypothetical protein
MPGEDKLGGRTAYRTLSSKRAPFQIGVDRWSHLRKVPRRRRISHTYPVWLWGCNSREISSPGPIFHGTKWLLWRPHIQSLTLHSRCGINKGLIKRGSTIDHWRSWYKCWILWPTRYTYMHTYIHTYIRWRSNSMELNSSWEPDVCSAGQEMPRILRNHKIYLHIHNIRLLVPSICQINPFHTPPSYLFKILFILSSIATHSYSKWSRFFTFSYQNFVCILVLFRMYYTWHLFMLFDLIIQIISGKEYKLIKSLFCNSPSLMSAPIS